MLYRGNASFLELRYGEVVRRISLPRTRVNKGRVTQFERAHVKPPRWSVLRLRTDAHSNRANLKRRAKERIAWEVGRRWSFGGGLYRSGVSSLPLRRWQRPRDVTPSRNLSLPIFFEHSPVEMPPDRLV